LMDIAFMVKDAKSGQPVFPLTVARDGVEVEANVARSEKMLSHAVIHAASADVPVNPITRVDLNIAKGISRAVEEKRITNIVIGWNGEVSTHRKIFGSVLDQLLDEVDEMVMVCKIDKPVNTFKRLVVALPPFATLEIGFPGTMRSIKLMAEQMGTELVVISTNERLEKAKKNVEKVKPDIDIEFKSINIWADITDWLSENQDEDDLFVLVSSREGTLSWRPGLDRLPRVISQKYPTLSFITTYSSEIESEADQGMSFAQNTDIVNRSRIKLNLKSSNIENALEEMITKDEIFEHIAIERITRRLLENSEDYTPELMPGVLFYDSHTSKVDEQVLFVGTSKEGINVPQTANKGHIILVMLSPKEMKVQDHIQTMNRVIKLIRPGKDVEQIKNAKTEREVINAIMAR